MSRLFAKLLLLIILVLLGSKLAFEWLYSSQLVADRERVITSLHLGGGRLVAQQLLTTPLDRRDEVLHGLQQPYRSSLSLRPLSELDLRDREKLAEPYGYICQWLDGNIEYLAIRYDDQQYLRVGPLTDHSPIALEDSLWGWFKLLANKVDESDRTVATLDGYSSRLGLVLELQKPSDLPTQAMDRIQSGREVVVYSQDGKRFAAAKLVDSSEYLRLGPLPEFRDVFGSATRSTLLGAILLSGGLIRLLVHSLSKKFRSIEKAAQAIASGDLGARADESRAGEVRDLAKSLNLMANKTEGLIRSKREVLQMVSHELRTPLARLRFAVDLLDNKPEDPKSGRRMEIIHQSINDLELIVSEILDYVKNKEEFVVRSQDWIDVRKAIEPVLHAISEETPSLSIQHVPCQLGQRPLVYADRISLLRVAKNIAGNAQRYAKSKLIVRVYQVAPEVVLQPPMQFIPMHSMTCVEFEDDGPGIPEDKWSDVVEPFVRLSEGSQSGSIFSNTVPPKRTTHPKSYTGIGLGLTIVNRILKQHGGSVQVSRGELGGCLIRTFWPNPASQPPVV
jgi:two-component system sensor histidine kinase RstB